MLTKITNDLFHISTRIKKIDKNYIIMFNHSKGIYEVYFGNEFCISGGKILDSSLLEKVHKTNIRNINNLMLSMKEENNMLEEKEKRRLESKSKYTLKEFVEYADKRGNNCDFSQANTTRWF